MKRKYFVILVMTALLLWAALTAGLQAETPDAPLAVLAVTDHGRELLLPWEKDGLHVAIPSYVNLPDLKLHPSLLLDGQPLRAADLVLDHPYAIHGPNGPTTLTFHRSGGVPTLFVDTESGTVDQINASKDHQESGRIRLYTPDGQVDYSGRLAAVKGRGQSTFESSSLKKSYTLKLPVPGGLLGMDPAAKWVLTSNYYDGSNLRNKLVFDFAQAAGLAHSPQSTWVDLYLNGHYMGLYLLSEKNEIAPNRVYPADFLISKDQYERFLEQGSPCFVTDGEVPLRIHHSAIPESDMIRQVQGAENAILAPDGLDPETGVPYTDLIDLDSWAGKYLVEEIFGGGDAGYFSQYFYGRDGVLYAGPVWDYDVSMGADGLSPRMFYAHRPSKSPWFHALYNKGAFYRRVRELYEEVYQPLLEDLVETWIPRNAAELDQAARLSAIRWWGDPAAEAEAIQTYLQDRMDFLTDVWVRGVPCFELTVVMPGSDGYHPLLYAVEGGKALQDIEDLAPYSWFYPDETPFDKTKPIWQDDMIYGKE